MSNFLRLLLCEALRFIVHGGIAQSSDFQRQKHFKIRHFKLNTAHSLSSPHHNMVTWITCSNGQQQVTFNRSNHFLHTPQFLYRMEI
jgi:hypothetical protein